MSIGGGHVQRCVPVSRRHVDATLRFTEDPETLFPPVLTSHVHQGPACNKLEQLTSLVINGRSRVSRTRVHQSHKVKSSPIIW